MISGEQLKREGRKQFCPHGHDTYVCGRYSNLGCIICAYNNALSWQERHPEKVKANTKRWVKNNRKSCRNKLRRWRKENPEKHKACGKRYRLRHPEKCKLAIKQWRKENPEKCRIHCKRWRKNNPEKVRISNRKKNAERRALLRNATIGDLTEIAKKYSRAEELRRQGFDVVVDHIIPLSKGGAHSPENLQIIFADENNRKRANLTYKVKKVFH